MSPSRRQKIQSQLNAERACMARCGGDLAGYMAYYQQYGRAQAWIEDAYLEDVLKVRSLEEALGRVA